MSTVQHTQFPNIPGFIIQQKIASGGMAYVFRAIQEGLDRELAIKILRPEFSDNPKIHQHFVLEGRIIAGLNHPNIVQVHASGEAGGNCYLAMELLAGGTLEERINAGLSPDESIRIIRHIAAALTCVHQQGFIHRDIKPQNIVFRDNGVAVLTDFGIAKSYVEEWQAERTGTGIKKGTARYMSPDQLRGLELDGRSDLYSLGVVFHWMLSGQRPYDNTSIEVLLRQIMREPFPPLPAELADFQPILERMLAKDREDRFPDAAALIQSLDELENRRRAGAGTQHITQQPPPRAKPWLLALGATLVGVAAGYGAAVLLPTEERTLMEQIQQQVAKQSQSQQRHESTITETEATLAALRQQLIDLQTQSADTQAQYEAQLAALQIRQEALQAQRDAQRRELDAQKNTTTAQIDAERAQLATLEAEITALTTLVETADSNSELDTLHAQRDTLQARKAQLQRTLDSLQSDAATARENAEAEIAGQQQQLADLRRQLDERVEELENLRVGYQQQLDEFRDNQAGLQQQIAEQQQLISSKTAELQALQSDASTQLDSERAQISALTEQIATLESRLASADGSGELQKLRAERDTLQARQKQLQSTLDNLQNDAAKARHSAEAEIAREQATLTDLKNQLDQRLKALETTHADYQQQLSELRAEAQTQQQRIAAQQNTIISETRDLQNEVDRLRDTLASRQTDAGARITELRQAFNTLQQSRDELSQQLARSDDSDPRLTALREQLDSADNVLSSVQEQLHALALPEPVPQQAMALMAEARNLIAQDLLTVGRRNAQGICQQILRLHTASGEQCLAEIADRFLALSIENLHENDQRTADEYIQRGLQISNDHPGLIALQRSMNLLQEADVLIAKNQLLVDGENDALARLLAAREATVDNPLVNSRLEDLLNAVQGSDGLQGQTLAQGLNAVTTLLTRFPHDPRLIALQQTLQTRQQEALQRQEQEARLLAEAQHLANAGQFDPSTSPNACSVYQQVLALNPDNQEALEVLASHCIPADTLKQIQVMLASVSSPPTLENQHALISILGLAPGYQPACQKLASIAADLHQQAQNLGAEEHNQALQLLKDGLDLWPEHPQLQTLAAELRADLDSEQIDTLIQQAYNQQVRERVQEAWQRYQQALALDPQNTRVAEEISKLARWSLAYRSGDTSHVIMADQIYRQLLRMGQPYEQTEKPLQRIAQLYRQRHGRNADAQQRLASLRVLMANQGHSPVSDCELTTTAE